jgi:hypothetical protein
MVANFWLRSGNTSSANNFISFLEDTLSNFGNKVVGLIRLDSGFYQKEILDYLENMPKNYIVAVRFTRPVQQHISGQKSWVPIDDGIEICDSTYQAQNRDKPGRTVIVRQKLAKRPNAPGKQLSLFPEDEIYRSYRYSAYVTNLEI